MSARAAGTAAGLWLLVAAAGCGTLSVEDEKELGHQAQRQVQDELTLLRDRVTVSYIRALGDALVASAKPSPFEFRFYVIEADDINAFALPGGAIYLNSGILLKANDASEVAGVLAHEIGHVTARHVAHLYRRQRNTGVVAQVVAIAIAIVTGNPYLGNAASLGTGIAATAYLSQFSKEAESEADELAVETLVRAGWDPNGMVSLFETLDKEMRKGLRAPQFLSSHPAPRDRMQAVRARIQGTQLPAGLKRDDGGRLDIIQERIRLVVGTEEDIPDVRRR